ncbi:hypothetical protein SCUCBS95973_009359 [Sporothrix curviconia]|uniref:Uncharacterized protein n=1 Tax=Sporothrix curviconia TaxID=1260050 RepID=A0ABP0CX31_9PEZI
MANKKQQAKDGKNGSEHENLVDIDDRVWLAFRAYRNGILDPQRSQPPANLEDLRQRFGAARDSASSPESTYDFYTDTANSAVNEATMVYEVGVALLQGRKTKGYRRAMNQAFTAFPKDVGFNNGLSAPQPDFVEGLDIQEYEPFLVEEEAPSGVLYKDNPHSITLAHLAGEWKGAGKDMERARLQSAYDGAALVYARNQALAVTGKPDSPGHAAVTTFTTDGSHLYSYAHYATGGAALMGYGEGQAEDEGEEHDADAVRYHQYLVQKTNLVDSHAEFKKGRRLVRNQQDYAKEQSYELKDCLRKQWKRRHSAVRAALQTAADGAPMPQPREAAAEEADEPSDEADAVVPGRLAGH